MMWTLFHSVVTSGICGKPPVILLVRFLEPMHASISIRLYSSLGSCWTYCPLIVLPEAVLQSACWGHSWCPVLGGWTLSFWVLRMFQFSFPRIKQHAIHYQEPPACSWPCTEGFGYFQIGNLRRKLSQWVEASAFSFPVLDWKMLMLW